MISALDHIQLAMPAGGEREARGFYSGLLGLNELEKPAPLAARGGAGFALPDGRQLHLGVEAEFRPQRRAFPGMRRFYTEDDHGNRLEFLHPRS